MNLYEPFHPKSFSDPKVMALQTALHDRDPYCSGRCAISDYQRLLYYTHGDLHRRIDLSNAGADDLEALYRACKPAEFGRNGESVLDESYRKAGKLDLTTFSMPLNLRRLGIHEQVSKALLVQSHTTMDAELYKLNVYGKGDFFKAHKDTPRGLNMFGSLVIVLPTVHQGGQFVLRQGKKEWTIDFAEKLATAPELSVCFVAFFGDIEHEVLPVTSGHRITLTYNLYHKPISPTKLSILTPFHLKLKQALLELVNDSSTLTDGGYLGFGLVHGYVHAGHNLVEPLLGQLKGSDRALADVCDELGLRYSLRLLYREIMDPQLNLVTAKELKVKDKGMDSEQSSYEALEEALDGFTIDEAEGIIFAGRDDSGYSATKCAGEYGLEAFYKNPATEVLEVTRMKSSVDIKSTYVAYGNEPYLDHFYGTACMLIALGPSESRNFSA